jgi:hypothetical protein
MANTANFWQARPPHQRCTVIFFFESFGSKIQIGNQQVLGQNWVKKVVINKFSLGKNLKNGTKLQV